MPRMPELSAPEYRAATRAHQSAMMVTHAGKRSTPTAMLATLTLLICIAKVASADITPHDVEFLNQLPLDKLLRLKTSLQGLVTSTYDNVTTTPTYLESFGAQAMAVRAPPVKRTDFDDGLYKKGEYSKVSSIFTMSVTTLAFLAFGGYLLCLIVQAVKAKQSYNPTPMPPTTIIVSAGIKKRPQAQQSYGRRRRSTTDHDFQLLDLPPEQMFSALLQLCEGYAQWNEKYGDLFVH